MIDVFDKLDWARKLGKALMSYMERDIQEWLEQLLPEPK